MRIDLPELEAGCRKIPGVVFVGVEPYPCSRPGLAAVKEVIREARLERAVVAGCSPRLHGRLFAGACEEAGLNRWFVDVANIREHCSRVHTDKAGATSKAMDLVRGSVSKVCRGVPHETVKFKPVDTVLVVGGGVSGLTAAEELVRAGHKVTLIEKTAKLGGSLARVNNVYPHNVSGKEIVENAISKIAGKVEILRNTVVSSLAGGPGQYQVTLSSGDGSSSAGAVTNEASFGAVVVATGAGWMSTRDLMGAVAHSELPAACPSTSELMPALKTLFERLPTYLGRVLTQAELEEEIENGGVKSLKRAVFLNVVPGREAGGRLHSLIALKNAITLAHARPGIELNFVFDQIPREHERDFRRARDHGVRFFKCAHKQALGFTEYGLRVAIAGEGPLSSASSHGTVEPKQRRRSSVTQDSGSDASPAETVELKAELIVVPTLVMPPRENIELAQVLRIPVDSDGFMVEPHVKLRPGDFAERAVYAVGMCHSPVTLFESLAQAAGAAARVSRFLQCEAERAPFVSSIDEKVCRGCSRCAEACEWNAIDMSDIEIGLKLARVDPTRCTGCGVCATVCICGAPSLAPVSGEQVRVLVQSLGGS